MKALLSVLLATLLTASGAFAETTVTVSDVTAKQRYPWNGLVDITCTVSGIDGETNGLKLAVAAVMPDTGRARNVRHFRIVRDGEDPDDREVRTNGTYRLLWDAAADLGPVRFTNMVVRVKFDVHEKVQLWEGGPYWATTNIGAEEPEEYGLYFWWGDTVGYRREGNAWVASDGSSQNFSFESGTTPTYNKSRSTLQSEGWIVTKDGTDVLAPEHDAAHVHWGGSWRMPTNQELYDLCCNKCDWTWTTQNGVNGYVVRGRGDYSANSIFLPAAGWGEENFLFLDYDSSDPVVCYWASSFYDCFPDFLAMPWDYPGSYNLGPDYGQSVRPVQGFAE